MPQTSVEIDRPGSWSAADWLHFAARFPYRNEDRGGRGAGGARGGAGAKKEPGKEEPQGEHLPCSAATAGPDGDGILIQLAYTDADSSGFSLGNHAFVLAIDTSRGRVYASRGGPGSGPGGGAGIAPNDFVARSGPADANFPDQLSEVHAVQTVGYIDAPFASVVSYLNAFSDVTNSNGLNYWGPVQNSNSYALTLIEGLGFARPEPAVRAPGYSTNSVDPRLACTGRTGP